MAGRAPSEAINIATRHAVFLERLKTHEANKVAALLEDVAAEIRDRLSRVDITDIGRANMERLIAGVEKMLGERFTDYRKATREQLLAIAVDEARFGAREIGAVATNYEPAIPAAAQVRSAALSQPLAVQGPAGGKLLTPFLQRFQSNEIDRITSAMRIGFTQGDTTTQLTQRLLGTRGQQFRDGQLAITERSARAVVRTAISHMSSVAKMEVGKENADIVRGIRIVATLDSRTSTTCQSMDGREYPMDKAPLPPYHPNCRTAYTYALDKRFDVLDRGATRASRGADGGEQVPSRETYYSWLKDQPAAFQDEAIGPQRAKLLREGGLSADRFSRLQLDKNFQPLTLERMRELEPLAFDRSGLDA